MKPKLIRISPSILAIDYNNEDVLTNALSDIEKYGANFVHVDVMDGVFVKNKHFSPSFVNKLRDMTNLMLDVHLMVQNPENVIEEYAKAGADIITVHYEACKDVASVLKKIKSLNCIAGVAINPKTPALKLRDLLEQHLADVVVVMGVNPGAYGQKFIPGSAEKVAEVRDMDKRVFIEIDGGVNLKNVKILRKMGVNIIVSGATVFESKNMKKTISMLKGSGLINHLKEHFK